MADEHPGLVVKSPFNNTAGVYDYVGEHEEYPYWQRQDGKPFIYKMFGEHWAIGDELGSGSSYNCVEGSSAATPLEVPEWQGSDEEMTVVELVPVDASAAPHTIRIESKFGNIDGGFVRMDDDFEDYPAYHNEQDGVYLFHTRGGGEWKIASELDTNAGDYNSCATDEVNVTKLTARNWRKPDSITTIAEVTWANTPDDDGFLDTNFPADHPTLGKKWMEENPKYLKPGSVEWIRAPDLNREEPEDLLGNIRPDEMLQGAVGDCWLIAAIACVAEFPSAIAGLIEPKEVSEDGMYTVRLYNVKTSQWEDIVIDDLIPCDKRWFWQRQAAPIFAKLNGNILWPVILEKAFAKFVKNYGDLSGGQTSWAWQAMTGCEEQLSYSKNDSGGWDKLSVKVDQQKEEMENGDRRACPFFYTNDRDLDAEAIWKIINEADLANYLMSASLQAGNEIEHKRDDGLVEGHAYSLISAVAAGGFRLVKLRNPWGQHEWNGAWADDSGEWDEHPELKDELCPQSGADGLFYMDFDDFISIFTGIYVSPYSMSEEKQGKMEPARQRGVRGIKKPSKPKKAQSHSALFCGDGKGGCSVM